MRDCPTQKGTSGHPIHPPHFIYFIYNPWILSHSIHLPSTSFIFYSLSFASSILHPFNLYFYTVVRVSLHSSPFFTSCITSSLTTVHFPPPYVSCSFLLSPERQCFTSVNAEHPACLMPPPLPYRLKQWWATLKMERATVVSKPIYKLKMRFELVDRLFLLDLNFPTCPTHAILLSLK